MCCDDGNSDSRVDSFERFVSKNRFLFIITCTQQHYNNNTQFEYNVLFVSSSKVI